MPYPDQDSWCNGTIFADADVVQSIRDWKNENWVRGRMEMENTPSSKMADQNNDFITKKTANFSLF